MNCLGRSLLFLLLVLYNFLTVSRQEMATPSTPELYVIRGKHVKRGKYPFAVSLQLSFGHFCGGAILNEDSILTAAHCLNGRVPAQIKVYIGNVDISKLSPKFLFTASKLILHQKFNRNSVKLGYDIGIIKLKEKIDFNQFAGNAGKACLPAGSDDLPDTEADCRVIGWGRNEKNQRQTLLHEAPFKIQDHRVCEEKGFKGYNTEMVYCALDDQGKGRSCLGDSGGPLICKSKCHCGGDRWIQYGIVSFGGADCQSEPSYFTAVDEYTGWIQENTKS